MSAGHRSADRAALLHRLAATDEDLLVALGELLEIDASERRELVDEATVATALVAALDRPHRTQQRRVADALLALLPGAPALRTALAVALATDSPRLRWGAAYVLGRAGSPPPEVWAAASEAMAIADGDQRWAAAELACLAVRTHPELRTALLAGLESGSATLRKMTLYCLRDLGDPEGGSLARARLRDGDAGVRLAALAALAHQAPSDANALAISERVTEDPDLGVRRAAAAVLGRVGVDHPIVRTTLEQAADNSDPSLARAAKAALAARGGDPSGG
jgi:HEAT repeat protein